MSAKIYLRREGHQIHRNLEKDVVLELCILPVYYDSDRVIVPDNFLTSYSLALALLQQNLTLIGTIRVNRAEVPQELIDNRHQVLRTKFAHDYENKIVLASYISQEEKGSHPAELLTRWE